MKIGNTACTQTETIDVDERTDADVEKTTEKMEDNEFITTSFVDDGRSSDDDI